jgi:hypothetical protein
MTNGKTEKGFYKPIWISLRKELRLGPSTYFYSTEQTRRSGKYGGRCAAKDIFVATNFALRDALGGWQSREWRDVKIRARTVWSQLFQNYQPLKSTNIHDVVSGAIDGKYFKGR